MVHPERWGALRERYETPRPRRMLALDGGGMRGLITLGILEKLEAQLRSISTNPDAFRLCDWFDYIGGTSTGAIIATGLARGMSVAELIHFYQRCGADMFHKSRLLERWRTFYEADPLRERLRAVFGEATTLEPEFLRCLLLIVTRNAGTDSPWPISSNPEAKFNAPDNCDCNLRIPLWQLVRASTAAPVYFPPEVIHWDPGNPANTSIFVDGGMTPYNNPAFLLYRMATQSAYQLGWPTGERNLLLVSVGTGAAPVLSSPTKHPEGSIVSEVAAIPGHLMYAIAVDQDITCRTVGRCTYGSAIDAELSDMIEPATLPGEVDDATQRATAPSDNDAPRAFLYTRYNPDISSRGLAALGLPHVRAAQVQRLDAIDEMDNLLEIGRIAGDAVQLDHFRSFVREP